MVESDVFSDSVQEHQKHRGYCRRDPPETRRDEVCPSAISCNAAKRAAPNVYIDYRQLGSLPLVLRDSATLLRCAVFNGRFFSFFRLGSPSFRFVTKCSTNFGIGNVDASVTPRDNLLQFLIWFFRCASCSGQLDHSLKSPNY